MTFLIKTGMIMTEKSENLFLQSRFTGRRGSDAVKKFVMLLLSLCLCFVFSGCSNPNRMQLELRRGYGAQLKLLHLNAVSKDSETRIEEFMQITDGAQALDRPLSLFGYYPDYLLTITQEKNTLTLLVDINVPYVDFIYPEGSEEQTNRIYRSAMTSDELLELVHRA